MDREQIRIRGYQPGDRDDVYRVCLQTADNGGDGTAIFRDPRLPGDVYAVPYAIFEPSLTLVPEDAGGVGGYVLAPLDSQEFGPRPEPPRVPPARPPPPQPPP